MSENRYFENEDGTFGAERISFEELPFEVRMLLEIRADDAARYAAFLAALEARKQSKFDRQRSELRIRRDPS